MSMMVPSVTRQLRQVEELLRIIAIAIARKAAQEAIKGTPIFTSDEKETKRGRKIQIFLKNSSEKKVAYLIFINDNPFKSYFYTDPNDKLMFYEGEPAVIRLLEMTGETHNKENIFNNLITTSTTITLNHGLFNVSEKETQKDIITTMENVSLDKNNKLSYLFFINNQPMKSYELLGVGEKVKLYEGQPVLIRILRMKGETHDLIFENELVYDSKTIYYDGTFTTELKVLIS